METKTYTHPKPFQLESGKQLQELNIAYHTYGTLNRKRDNVIWVCHALTANSDVFDWWPGLFGPENLFNPREHFIVCANVLGSPYGTTNPLSIHKATGQPYFLSFPAFTIRDIVGAHQILADHLGIDQISVLIGGSLGGQQALEWSILQPDRIRRLVLIATNAVHSPWGIAFNESQRLAIRTDPTFEANQLRGGEEGLKAARSIALLSYRTYTTYGATQLETDLEKLDDYKAASYQNYQGEKLVNRFNAYSYWYLSKAMDSHHVGRGRGSLEGALSQVRARTLVLGVSSDLLFPIDEQKFLANHIPHAVYEEIDSFYGHDGFLIETEAITQVLKIFLGADGKNVEPKAALIDKKMPITWEGLAPIFRELKDRELTDLSSLERWLQDRSELDAFLQEDYAWRYIRMTCDTENSQYLADFEFFATEIEPKLASISNELDKKLHAHPLSTELDEHTYGIYLRQVANSISLYREENVPLLTQIQVAQQRYGAIAGAMTVWVDGQELTLAQAAVMLKDTDREKRETIWKKINTRRLADKKSLDELFDELRDLRHRVALQADFPNFRDYSFRALGRFDYTAEDCEDFHQAIASEVVPLLRIQAEKRREKLGLPSLRPWDMEVDTEARPALRPFQSGSELIEKTIQAFTALDPYIGQCLSTMSARGLFDVDSRKGKAPGGYNYPLAATGMPFIFMNAAGTFSDLTTMLHEGGHALHTFISADLELNDFKEVPSEVAELASMSMELISMDQWEVFFPDRSDLLRAKEEQLEDVLKTLPWVATIDEFQHWLYLHPQHSTQEREAAWLKIYERYGAGFADWFGLEEERANLWQKQLHIYEVPFYYIEYGMAQLGAIAIWKNYREDPARALEQYLAALRLGYTKTIPEIYETAGIRFDFSAKYVRELVGFVKEELEKLQEELCY